MMLARLILASGVLALALHAPTRDSTLRLPKIFTDGMVVQRDQPLPVWGWSTPRARVSVSIGNRRGVATSDTAGQWRVVLPPLAAGGPHTLTVSTDADHIELHDILAGDVWVASGQSNMEFAVRQANNSANEIASAHDSSIRQFKVPTSWSYAPESDLAGGSWVPADPQHAGAFTAVGYFFARALRTSEKIPIGIINTNWGGSAIEAWMTRGALRLSDSAWNAAMAQQQSRGKAVRDALRAKLGFLPEADSGLVNGVARWADASLDDRAWSSMPVPAYWEGNGYESMDGVAWYRTTFALSEVEAQSPATLNMTAIDDDDVTWVNGVEVGRTNGYNVPRHYVLPPRVLHAGINTVAVRVNDTGGGGGINAPVTLSVGSGPARSLAGNWKFRVGVVSFGEDGQQINKVPTVLYNRMIHPLLPFPVKGVIWYQGESNANNMEQASAYRTEFASMITTWRKAWTSGTRDFPFLWVQLPNYGALDTVPPPTSAWATQRESMTSALALPATGQAIAIDVGDPGNIHPTNKQDVGARLALVARDVAYHEHVVSSGPTYRASRISGGKVIVSFNNDAGLVSRGSDGVAGAVAIAGADKQWVWANARVVGNRLEVWSDRVKTPVAVRYAWSNSPVNPGLYNGAGLPAAPFRTDKW